jgi:hypothetical protein
MKLRKKILNILGFSTVAIILYYLFKLTTFYSAIPSPHSVKIDTVFANNLINDFEEYQKIVQLDDCSRSYKYINGIKIRLEEQLDKSKHIVHSESYYPRYYKEVLKELDIKEQVFENFRERLEKSKLYSYHKIDSISLFVVDGFMDGHWGYFYNHGNRQPQEYFRLGSYGIRRVERLGPSWYRYAGYY